MVEKRPEPRNPRNQSTYKYLHPPGRRGANIRIRYRKGKRLSAACRTGLRQRREEQEGRMQTKNSALGRRPLWILTSYKHNQMQPLTLDPDGDGGFLPVFSFEEEADAFLQLLRDEEGKERG